MAKIEKTILSDTIIFSAYRESESEGTNRSTHNFLAALLATNGIEFIEGTGCYKGTVEQNFILKYSQSNGRLVKALCRDLLGQESFLQVDRRNEAFNKPSDPNTYSHSIGKIKEVTREYALTMDGYTIIDCRYFTAE